MAKKKVVLFLLLISFTLSVLSLNNHQTTADDRWRVEVEMDAGTILCEENNASFEFEGLLNGARIDPDRNSGNPSKPPLGVFSVGGFEIVASPSGDVANGELNYVRSVGNNEFMIKGVLIQDNICQSNTPREEPVLPSGAVVL